MQYFNLEHISLSLGFLLILIGIWGILSQKNILKIIISFTLFDTGIHVLLVAIAYMKKSTAPILNESVDLANAHEKVADPVPQALVLTAIVIGLGITALMLAYALKMHKSKKSLDINIYNDLKW